MTWTKQHSQNAVAAKARRRMEGGSAAPPAVARRNIHHRRSRAAFVVQIRDLEHQDSLTLRLHRLPWRGRFLCADGEISTARIVKAIAAILNAQL